MSVNEILKITRGIFSAHGARRDATAKARSSAKWREEERISLELSVAQLRAPLRLGGSPCSLL